MVDVGRGGYIRLPTMAIFMLFISISHDMINQIMR